jgi:DNA-binding response OmpR family regulator
VFPSRRQAFAEGEPVDLTPAEFNILLALLKAGGDILSREQLRLELGSVDQSPNERVVDVHVAAMRKKLGNARKIIKTVHGKGYRIVL